MKRQAFTLVELLMVIAIIAILAGMAVAALAGAAEEGRRTRARAQIAKIDQLINDHWNGYRYRQVPIRVPSNTDPVTAARGRLIALRELMRMELPDRLSDLDDPAPFHAANNPFPITRPSLSRAYQRRVATATPNASYEQAECLYLIIAEMRDGERSALDFFHSSEIGDIDGDGLPEILDPWGTPIMFLRWAPGFSKFTTNDPELAGVPIPPIDNAVATFQVPDGRAAEYADPHDPLKRDPRWSNSASFKPFLLRPLIFSAGPDRVYDIYTDNATTTLRYRDTVPPSDPYTAIVTTGGNVWVGTPADYDNDGLQHGDNITNHGLALEGE
jgi:prepilin-type N-terminal cleavage/methylation domain-containing protein